MSARFDPSGYYAALGVDPTVDDAKLKLAYRERAKALHPDTNANHKAVAEFQRVTEAWDALRSPAKRALYDSGLIASDRWSEDSPNLFPCCRCGQVTAQPRYVVFREVKSFLIWAKVARSEGVFCRACADRVAALASTRTWLMGWWSIPGLVLTPLVLIGNLLGGKKPKDSNAKLLLSQARAFLNRGDMDIAQGVAYQAAYYAKAAGFNQSAVTLMTMAKGKGKTKRLKDRWSLWRSGVFYAQLLPLLLLPLVIAALVMTVIWKPSLQELTVDQGQIHVATPAIGEVRHVAIDAIKLRIAPKEGAPVLTLLDRFSLVTVLAPAEDKDWVKVRSSEGAEGFVPLLSLYGGSPDIARHEWCSAHMGSKLQAGEVLFRRATGDHQVLIHNGLRQDAVVKLKTTAGYTIASIFVPATYRLGITGVPEGTYLIEYAVGSDYSRACSMFVKDMQQYRLSIALTLHHLSSLKSRDLVHVPEVSLTDLPGDPGKPQSIATERFVSDD